MGDQLKVAPREASVEPGDAEVESAEVILHQFWLSSCSWRVRLALELKNIKHTKTPVRIENGKIAEEYTKLNPMRQVPTLEIDGVVLTQSVAILEYLEETRPTPALLPKDAKTRAICRRMVEIINAGIQPIQNPAVSQKIAKLGGDQMAWSRLAIEKGFMALEREVAAVPGRDEDFYMCTKEVTFADIMLVPQVANTKRFDVDMSQFPLLSQINKRLEQLEAFKAAHISLQPGFVAPK
mmetsp:Transcript_3940/g.6929  ORF Transcript_3940/g.6929 Transcript_3940/m.6929 type:complete len:238 (+) Transcript_3940:101-814(+)